MNDFLKTIDQFPLILKIVLALPVLDIVWVIYRIVKSAQKQSMFGVVLGIIMIIVGIPFLWLIDIISLIVCNKVLWID